MLKPLVFSLLMQYPMTPVQNMTPGDFCSDKSADFDGYRYEERIPHCRRNVSSATKRRVYEKYRIPERDRDQYTIDHLIPLSIGGSNSIENLWPEAVELKRTFRPTLEDDIYKLIRDGEIEHEQAVECMYLAKYELINCLTGE